MQSSLNRLEASEQQLDAASGRLKSDIQTVGMEAEQMQRASKQMFDELVGMLMRGRKELMQSVTEQRQRRVNELAGKHSSVTQKLNQVREAKRQCENRECRVLRCCLPFLWLSTIRKDLYLSVSTVCCDLCDYCN